jgi:hypothetical protein
MDGLIMMEYARKGCPAADMPTGLQAAYWAHFLQYIPPSTVKVNPSWQCKVTLKTVSLQYLDLSRFHPISLHI